MKGDFSRDSFDAKHHFSRVLLQQGRVTLDADPNEQADILLHCLRTLARDLIGAWAGPSDALGFELLLDTTTDPAHPTLSVSAGRYYVDGILVENDAACDYARQPDATPPASDALLQRLASQLDGDVWVYLDVWERHVSWIEDDAIREPALGGPDTCTRTKVVWQLRSVARETLLASLKARLKVAQARLKAAVSAKDAVPVKALTAWVDRLKASSAVLGAAGPERNDCAAPLAALEGLADLDVARLAARLDPGQQIKDPCVLSPDALYRGVENQLYRVEVHHGNADSDSNAAGASGVERSPTFKWSRDNGSVATRWLGTHGKDLIVANARGFSANTWVELSDDTTDLQGGPGVLVRLVKVEGDRLSVDAETLSPLALTPAMRNPKVRRWDQRDSGDIQLDAGAVPVREASATDPAWCDLEDGIQVQFSAGGRYRSGDYWLIPARVATGDIDWPRRVDGEVTSWQLQPPHGVEHHHAPLGFVGLDAAGVLAATPCLCTIEPIRQCGAARAVNAGPADKLGDRLKPAGANRPK